MTILRRIALVLTAGARKQFFWRDGRKAPFWLTWPIFKGYAKKLASAGTIKVKFLDWLKLETVYRLATAASLYFEDKVDLIFLAGGQTGQRKRDSVTMMKDFLLELGVQEEDIILDPSTLQTSDSVEAYANYVKSIRGFVVAYIITSWYHVPRSLYHLKKFLPASPYRFIKVKAAWPSFSKECLAYEYAYNLSFEPLKLLSMPFESVRSWWREREEKLREVKK